MCRAPRTGCCPPLGWGEWAPTFFPLLGSSGLEQRCPHAHLMSFVDTGPQQDMIPTSVVGQLCHPENPLALGTTVWKFVASAAGCCCLVSWHSFKSHTPGQRCPSPRRTRCWHLPVPGTVYCPCLGRRSRGHPAGSRVPGAAGTRPGHRGDTAGTPPGHGRDTAGAAAAPGAGCRAPVCPGRQIRVAQATGTEKARRDGGRWVHKGVCFLY